MSSSNTVPPRNKSRASKACDVCRTRKIRCDTTEDAGRPCTHCVSHSLNCAFTKVQKKRGAVSKTEVNVLEARVAKLSSLLRQHCPKDILDRELGLDFYRQTIPLSVDPNVAPPDSDDDDHEGASEGLAAHLERLRLNPTCIRYTGQSSAFLLTKKLLKIKDQRETPGPPKPPFIIRKRNEFWALHPHELGPEPDPSYSQSPLVFPAPDHLLTLIDLYFTHVNPFLPLLHKPTFMSLLPRMHEPEIGYVVLLVCALGSRHYIKVPSTLGEGTESGRGWAWYHQVQHSWCRLKPPSVLDVQVYALSAMFVSEQHAWLLVSMGLRLAQDIGAHRRWLYEAGEASVHLELWKRAFWVLVSLDRRISATLGRPCSIQNDDFDLDYPAACDDQYLNAASHFRQPEGEGLPASYMAYFMETIKLDMILGRTLRTIYTTNKSGITKTQAAAFVIELEDSLKAWEHNVPPHLKCPVFQPSALFSNQSLSMHSHAQYIRLLIHTPFLPSPALQVRCRDSAVAICNIQEVVRTREGVFDWVYVPAFTAATILLSDVWNGSGSETSVDLARVQNCLDALKEVEGRSQMAGKLWDILTELTTVNRYQIQPHELATTFFGAEPEPQPEEAEASFDWYGEPGGGWDMFALGGTTFSDFGVGYGREWGGYSPDSSQAHPILGSPAL